MAKLLYFDGNKRNMDSGNKTAAATAAPGTAAGAQAPVKEIFSIIIRKLEEGITDGCRTLWARFADEPHVVALHSGDGYVVWLWRDGVVVRITFDENFEVTGFDVEVKS